MFRRNHTKVRKQKKRRVPLSEWVAAGMKLTFRAEVMPGREREERTFTVVRVLTNGRVELSGMSGQHAETEFEALR